MQPRLDPATSLPADGTAGTLVGRAWVPGDPPGPSVVVLRGDEVVDVSAAFPTLAHLLNAEAPAAQARAAAAQGQSLGTIGEVLANSAEPNRDPGRPWFLAPADLQALKACGVTFAASLLERVIEEQAEGDRAAAEAARQRIVAELGSDLSKVVPGSDEAARLKALLQARGLWSQYLEVGIGPDAEVFTKGQPMSALGTGAVIGLHPDSRWSNPEPEAVLAVDARGECLGATLGNDVNLRDFEGRSALLLGKSKDNNGSCALGPFLRLFDGSFSLDDLRTAEIGLTVEGDDGFRLLGASSLARISRDPLDLVAQTIGPVHQYPDGLLLMTGTMFAPTEDRGAPGEGFTHKPGDLVTIASPKLGALVNSVGLSDAIPPWTFGTAALMENLAARGLLERGAEGL
ncbi:MAG: fumarylacetoacetate hydrolase family protein [Rhodospirillales bacterium]|nr:fumarylacetoacetate hydrolase family protein [Rhodospirillales bacterium]